MALILISTVPTPKAARATEKNYEFWICLIEEEFFFQFDLHG